ncbi:MAG: S-layer homology domain-containing protein [Eubacteriales bacterium]
MRNIIYGTLGLGSVLALGIYIFTTQTNTTSSILPDSSTAQVQTVESTENVTTPEAVVLTETIEHYTVSDIFSDLDNSAWYTKYVQRVYDEGLVEGTSDTTFEPESPLTFAVFSVMVSKAYHGTELTDNKYIYEEESKADWTTAYTQTLKNIYGTNSEYQHILDSLEGNSHLSRYHASSLVGMLLTTEGVATGDYSSTTAIFTDLGDLGATETSLLGVANEFEVMTGITDSTFEGNTILTRAQACVIFCALLDLSEGNQLERDNYSPENQPSQEAIQQVEQEKQAEAEAQAKAEAEALAQQQAQSKPSTSTTTTTPAPTVTQTPVQTPTPEPEPTPTPEPTPAPSTPSGNSSDMSDDALSDLLGSIGQGNQYTDPDIKFG